MTLSKSHHTLRRYRVLYRPDPEIEVFDVVPVFPPEASYRNHQFLRDYHREVAWSIDYRGDNDDIPTLLFVGAGYTLVKHVFLHLFSRPSPLISGFRLYRDYYLYQRQSKAWVRIAVELKDFDSHLMSLEDLGVIVARNIQKNCLCNIRFVKLSKFLNL